MVERLPVSQRHSSQEWPLARNDEIAEMPTMAASNAVLVGGSWAAQDRNSDPELQLRLYSHRRCSDDCATELAALSDALSELQGSVSVRLVGVEARKTEHRTSLPANVTILSDLDTETIGDIGMRPRTDRERFGRRDTLSPHEMTVVRVLSMISTDADVSDVASVLKTDPGLQYRLLKYLNSAQISIKSYGGFRSFEHAIMLLGYKQMSRWLSMFLLHATVEGEMPHAYRMAVARGRQMELLGISTGIPEGERDALFLTGVFSYLEKVIAQPVGDLLASLDLDVAIRDALVSNTGRYAPVLSFVRSAEAGLETEMYRHFAMLRISPTTANRAMVEGIVFADESSLGD